MSNSSSQPDTPTPPHRALVASLRALMASERDAFDKWAHAEILVDGTGPVTWDDDNDEEPWAWLEGFGKVHLEGEWLAWLGRAALLALLSSPEAGGDEPGLCPRCMDGDFDAALNTAIQTLRRASLDVPTAILRGVKKERRDAISPEAGALTAPVRLDEREFAGDPVVAWRAYHAACDERDAAVLTGIRVARAICEYLSKFRKGTKVGAAMTASECAAECAEQLTRLLTMPREEWPDHARWAASPPVEMRAGDCNECGGPVFHRPFKPGEYDHDCTPPLRADAGRGAKS